MARLHRLDTFPAKELIEQYRNVFSSRNGLQVLIHMLYELGAFVEVSETAEDFALKNYGTRLLRIIGGGEASQNSIEEFLKRLVRQPLEKERKE